MSVRFDAIVLAGGTGERLGGVSKGDLELAGVRLLDRVIAGVSRADRCVVVGDVRVPPGVLSTVEEPSRSGPAAGMVAGLEALTAASREGARGPADWVLVAATDVPGAGALVDVLREEAGRCELDPTVDGIAPVDATGHPQWLAALYRREALVQAAAVLGDPRDRAVKALVGAMTLAPVEVDVRDLRDVDTWEDHAVWEQRLTTQRAAGRAVQEGAEHE